VLLHVRIVADHVYPFMTTV